MRLQVHWMVNNGPYVMANILDVRKIDSQYFGIPNMLRFRVFDAEW